MERKEGSGPQLVQSISCRGEDRLVPGPFSSEIIMSVLEWIQGEVLDCRGDEVDASTDLSLDTPWILQCPLMLFFADSSSRSLLLSRELRTLQSLLLDKLSFTFRVLVVPFITLIGPKVPY